MLHTLVSKFTTTQQLSDAIDPNVFRINLKKIEGTQKQTRLITTIARAALSDRKRAKQVKKVIKTKLN